jgi:hypothetical protein
MFSSGFEAGEDSCCGSEEISTGSQSNNEDIIISEVEGEDAWLQAPQTFSVAILRTNNSNPIFIILTFIFNTPFQLYSANIITIS